MRSNKIISLFSGSGGMDIGFAKAGFQVAVAVEQDPSCCTTLRTNNPDMAVLECDITQTTTEEILLAGKLKPLEAALVIGGPPCQSFSLAGQRMGLDDPRGRLVLEFIRIVRESLPVAFVMENVKGMQSWQGGKAINAVLNEISEPIHFQGKTYHYSVTYKVLNAVDYGVPQFRERVFVIGNRLAKNFVFPIPTHSAPEQQKIDLFQNQTKPYSTVWDAIGELPPAQEPSDIAKRVSKTIKGRIKKHGY